LREIAWHCWKPMSIQSRQGLFAGNPWTSNREEVMKSLTPGQQVVKIGRWNDETARVGDQRTPFRRQSPFVILMAGVQARARRHLPENWRAI
jgi:hypothetical protein